MSAEVLANYYKALQDIISLGHAENTFYDYGWGVDLLLSHFLKVFQLGDSLHEKMIARLNYHSKSPGEKFNGDHKPVLKSYPVADTAYKNLLKHLTMPQAKT